MTSLITREYPQFYDSEDTHHHLSQENIASFMTLKTHIPSFMTLQTHIITHHKRTSLVSGLSIHTPSLITREHP